MTLANVRTTMRPVAVPLTNRVAPVGSDLDFDPRDLGSRLQLWIGGSIPGLVHGDLIAARPDRSGWGNHFQQPTSSKRPTARQGVVAGRWVIRPDVVDDVMDAANGSFPQPNTVVAVAKVNDTAATKNLFCSATPGTENSLFFDSSEVFGAYAGTALTGSGSQVGAFHVFAAEFNTTSSKLHVDGAQNGSTGTTFTWTLGPFRLFLSPASAGPFSGDLADLIVYAGRLVSTLLRRLTRYLGRLNLIPVAA